MKSHFKNKYKKNEKFIVIIGLGIIFRHKEYARTTNDMKFFV